VAAAGGRVGGRFRQDGVYSLQNTREIAVDIVVPEPENAKTLAGQCGIALHITRVMAIEIMLSTVDLDDEAVFQTNKVNDVADARRLPAEMKTAGAPCSQMHPQLHLLRGHGFSQASCDLIRHRNPTRLASLATLPLQGRDAATTA
jgi:hypothetical protein